MEIYKEIDGDLIKLAQKGQFDVIAHGCNCFSTMASGIAPQMAKAFGCDKFKMEKNDIPPIDKLGNIDYMSIGNLIVVNCYTQFTFNSKSKPLDYEALTLCLRKMNYRFGELSIGLPKIGCGLAGGDWTIVKEIIKKELKDCLVTIVNYKK